MKTSIKLTTKVQLLKTVCQTPDLSGEQNEFHTKVYRSAYQRISAWLHDP